MRQVKVPPQIYSPSSPPGERAVPWIMPTSTPTITPPPFPWEKGVQPATPDHGGYEAVVLEVHVCRDAFQRIYTAHTLQGELDRKTAAGWPGGGMEEFSYALLLEGLRRESLLEMLIMLRKDPTFVVRLSAAPETQDQAIRDLARLLVRQVTSLAESVAEDCVREALAAVAPKPST